MGKNKTIEAVVYSPSKSKYKLSKKNIDDLRRMVEGKNLYVCFGSKGKDPMESERERLFKMSTINSNDICGRVNSVSIENGNVVATILAGGPRGTFLTNLNDPSKASFSIRSIKKSGVDDLGEIISIDLLSIGLST